MYYLWVVIFGAYYFGRVVTVFQVVLVLAMYAATLAAIDPGDVATSRWLSTAGLVIGTAVVVRMLSERIERCSGASAPPRARTRSPGCPTAWPSRRPSRGRPGEPLATAPPTRCCWRTSTGSRRSTTASATTPGTRRSAR